MLPVCLECFHNPFRSDRSFLEYSSNASRKGHSLHSGTPEKLFGTNHIFNHTVCPHELPEYSLSITNPATTQLEPKTNVKNVIRETFGTPYFFSLTGPLRSSRMCMFTVYVFLQYECLLLSAVFYSTEGLSLGPG